MTDIDKKSIGVSNSIGGVYQPLAGEDSSENVWSICYNESQKKITMNAVITPSSFMVDGSCVQLTSELHLEDINQLIRWCFQAKAVIKPESTDQKKSENSPAKQ